MDVKKILFIDDDPAIQDALLLIFPEHEYSIQVLSDGSSLIHGSFQVPDIFVLDKQLSGIDGLDLCRLLKQRENTSHVPVIILSASPGIHRLAKAAGADDVIEKPFKIRDLRETIASLI